jgi:hypothetical protein
MNAVSKLSCIWVITVQEAGPMRSKSKGKEKASVNDEAKEEAQVERLRKVKAEITVLQDIIDN